MALSTANTARMFELIAPPLNAYITAHVEKVLPKEWTGLLTNAGTWRYLGSASRRYRSAMAQRAGRIAAPEASGR